MNYLDLLDDIEKMAGMKLSSIKPGAEITIISIDRDQDRIILTTSTGRKRSRPLTEIRALWESLCHNSAIHVESVLSGAGSSRNQPETILANLPYVEWLRINRRKHISYVGTKTHPYGTLRQMDSVKAEEIKSMISNPPEKSDGATYLIVTDDTCLASNEIETLTGIPLKSMESGIYFASINNFSLWLISSDRISGEFQQGSYIIIELDNIPFPGKPIKLLDKELYVLPSNILNILITRSN